MIVRSGFGARLSMTSIALSNVVPYFAYSRPSMGITARTSYSLRILSHHSLNAGLSSVMPSPTMATKRPPGASLFRACSTCRAPFIVSRTPCMRPALELNGGFIRTTDGIASSGRTLSNCSAFS